MESTTQTCREARPGLYDTSIIEVLFAKEWKLLPQVAQRYELDLAYGEAQCLSEDELVRRSAYFKSIRGHDTYHFMICQRRPVQVDPDLKHRQNFFDSNAYGVGYATHGLFPYRGKFHPQMIKGILNIIGLRRGDLVLDPMCGCGTTLIEASIIGLNSVGVELSPFACLMTRAKLAGLEMDCTGFAEVLDSAARIFREFRSSSRAAPSDLFEDSKAGGETGIAWLDKNSALKELVLLAYLDTMGYATRRKTKTAAELFPVVLRRYLAALQEFNGVREELRLDLGRASVRCADARELDIETASVDAVVFSPPYSFAIDYVANDELQLRYLGLDPKDLASRMVGLIGGEGRSQEQRMRNRVERYFEDMHTIIGECARVMKPGACCVIVIGSNTNQTGGIALEKKMLEFGREHGLPLHKHITREIEGIRNTMREEHILIMRKK